MVVDCFAEPLARAGSESQLARAVGNLVAAIEAIDSRGEIVVRLAENLALLGPLETIPRSLRRS